MNRFLQLRSLLFYLLAILVTFFLGVTYARLTGAGDGQGLAAGAIVLGYGIIGSFFGLVASLLVVYAKAGWIVQLNKILAMVFLAFIAYFTYNYFTVVKPKRDAQQQEQQLKPKPTTPTAPAEDAVPVKPASLIMEMPANATQVTFVAERRLENIFELTTPASMGLGMFAPNVMENGAIHFYGKANKDFSEQTPIDSITFAKDQYGNLSIATAPPWLHPIHAKLDYGILFFSLKSISRNFVELEVNQANGKTAFVSRESGRIMYWPEFLLSVSSIELIDPNRHKVKVKALDHASDVNSNYTFLQPVRIQQDWILVKLIDDAYEQVGEGWVKWQENGNLLVKYSLLS